METDQSKPDSSVEENESDRESTNDEIFNNSQWCYLPDYVLYHIFSFLSDNELIKAGLVCKSWYRLSLDDFLWKRLFYRKYKIDSSIGLIRGRTWRNEYIRLTYNIPVVQTELLQEFADQVLHVSFSHNGEYFATCSKDGYILVWDSSYPCKIKYHYDMKIFCWKYTQYSQFNESDTLLLVSGVHFGSPHSTSGEIAVFSLEDGFELQCRVTNKPYDIFGTWYNDQHLLSGDLHWLAHLVSRSVLWINKASQESGDEHTAITEALFKFYNTNASSIRAVMVANCVPEVIDDAESDEREVETKDPTPDGRYGSGNPPSHRDISLFPTTGTVRQQPLPDAVRDKDHDEPDYATPIRYNTDYRKVETENSPTIESDDYDDSEQIDECGDVTVDVEDEGSEGSWIEDVETKEKILIFTTGSKTYTPHQIGFKRLKPFNFPKRVDYGPSLRERIAIRKKRKELENAGLARPEPNWLDYESVKHKFDKVDHLIDLHGHIIGMGLSPDHRYLYVNSRPWPQGYTIKNPLDPPPIAQEIDLHVVDLVTMKQVGRMLRSHKAYTPNNECFFIFLDVCKEYVASGAEDKHGYLWDRHYGVCLAKFPHRDVVNSVAFNPQDPEMLVTTSDDLTVKVWRSRAKVKALNLNAQDYPKGVDLTKSKK